MGQVAKANEASNVKPEYVIWFTPSSPQLDDRHRLQSGLVQLPRCSLPIPRYL